MFNKVLVDLHAEIDLQRHQYYNLERQAALLESEARELTEFLRDHRSRDNYQIRIIREYKTICSFCGSEEERENDYSNGTPLCCDKAVAEHDASLSVPHA